MQHSSTVYSYGINEGQHQKQHQETEIWKCNYVHRTCHHLGRHHDDWRGIFFSFVLQLDHRLVVLPRVRTFDPASSPALDGHHREEREEDADDVGGGEVTPVAAAAAAQLSREAGAAEAVEEPLGAAEAALAAAAAAALLPCLCGALCGG